MIPKKFLKNPFLSSFIKKAYEEGFESLNIESREYLFSDEVADYSLDKCFGIFRILEEIDHRKPIDMVINTEGGDVYAALKFYNLIRTLKVKINTHVSGCVMSAGTILSACTTGKRTIAANSFMMIHEISTWEAGQVSKLKARIKHTEQLQDVLIDLYIKHSKEKNRKNWERILTNETYFTPEEALKLGLVDQIV